MKQENQDFDSITGELKYTESDIIKNKDTDEVQWIKADKDTVAEEWNKSKFDEKKNVLSDVTGNTITWKGNINNENISIKSLDGITNSFVTNISRYNPVDKNVDDMEKQLGVKFNKDKVLDISRESLLDFIESNNQNSELSQEEIDNIVNNMLDAVKVPEVIERKEEMDDELGLSVEDLKSLYKYLSGKSTAKPTFLDRYLAGSQNKLIDFQHVITLIRLAQVPQLAAMNASIQQRLYSPENLLNLDVKELATASANISREISDILNNATKSIELINSIGRVDSKYQSLIDKLLVVPEDVLNEIEHLLENR